MRQRRGFALVLVLVLVALLVVLVATLASLARVDTRIGAAHERRVQARQNAVIGLHAALGRLQETAGPDDRLTGMAGIAGVGHGAVGNQRRNWCGVWTGSGVLLGWLVSGSTDSAVPAPDPGADRVVLVSSGSVGAESANSEHVAAGRIGLSINDPATGAPRAHGGFAYWVADEGVKIGAYSRPDNRVDPTVWPVIGATTSAAQTLRNALANHAARLPDIVSFEQLRVLPAPGAPLVPSAIRDNFHHVTLTHDVLVHEASGATVRSGAFNVNTTSQPAWAGIAATYNTFTPGQTVGNVATFANRMRDGFAASAGAGKLPNGPFASAAALGSSPLLANALQGLGPAPADFMSVVGQILAARSDTFRIRAYGDAVNPADGTRIESRAWCEAIVRRTPETSPPFGRRFEIVYFRWLGPEDI